MINVNKRDRLRKNKLSTSLFETQQRMKTTDSFQLDHGVPHHGAHYKHPINDMATRGLIHDEHPPFFGGGDHDYREHGHEPHGPAHGPHHGPPPHHEGYVYPPESARFRSENDANTLKASMTLLQTPHSVENRDVALMLVDNIQSSCAVDFEQFCSTPAYDLGSMINIMDFTQFLSGLIAAPMVTDDYATDDAPIPCDTSMTGPLGLLRGRRASDASPASPGVSGASPATWEVDTSTNGRDSSSSDSSSGGGDSSSNSSSGLDDDGDDAGITILVSAERYEPPVMTNSYLPPDEDTHQRYERINRAYEGPNTEYFINGTLGYGIVGDKCMYRNRASLSASCQAAIATAAEFRHQYWGEEQSYHHHMGGLFLFIFMFFGLLLLWKKRFSAAGKMHIQTTKDTNAVMETIYADSALKASVEAAYGKELPPLVSELPKRPSVCCLLFRCIAWFFIICLVAHSAAHITGALMHDMVFKGEDGSDNPPPKALVVAVLLLVVAIETAMVVMLIRSVRYCFGCCRGSHADNNAYTNGSGAGSYVSSTMNQLASLMPSFQGITASTGLMRADSSGYAPLPGDMESSDPYAYAPSSAEMTTFAPQPHPQQVPAQPAYAPQRQQQFYTGVPVQMPPASVRYTYNN